jgi:hypothetical protein
VEKEAGSREGSGGDGGGIRKPGSRKAAQQIADAYRWAGVPEKFRDYAPDKPHCYDAEIQEEALKWFDAHLKRAK